MAAPRPHRTPLPYGVVPEVTGVLACRLWARGYFVATSGNVTDDVLMRYIAEQDVEPQDDDFEVTKWGAACMAELLPFR
jgi:hypothetical protein